jgi:hypothetical protein
MEVAVSFCVHCMVVKLWKLLALGQYQSYVSLYDSQGCHVIQASTYASTSTRTGVVATLAATSTNVTTNARSGSSDVASTTTASTIL